MPPAERGRTHGLTLIEAMIALAILEVAVLAANYAIAAGQNHVQASENMLRATELADDLMEEILSRPFADPDGPSGYGPEPDETSRDRFDDADDYDDFVEQPGNIRDALGELYDDRMQAVSRMSWVWPYDQPIGGIDHAVPGLLAAVLVVDERGEIQMIVRFIPEGAP